MALKIDTEFKQIAIEKAYLRVAAPVIRRGNEFLEFVLEYAANESAPYFNAKAFECPYDLGGANPIEQAYEYLKTLPEFADAIDC